MRLLEILSDGDFCLTRKLPDNAIPQYAILSHTWGKESEEITFEDINKGKGRDKAGYAKLWFCGEQARLDGLRYFWIDTCCINKKDKAEFSHAISSMFRWYRNATHCYVYLSDVSTRKRRRRDESTKQTWEHAFRKSRWFTRGWTLQELLAPSSVEFFSQEYEQLGDKFSLEQLIHEITGVPKLALRGTPLTQFKRKERLSWIDHRQTKLEEDKAYSLLGIFDVDMHLRYGEGMASAFKRLDEEADKVEKCIQELRVTDPRDDKKRIENAKGGLLEDSYRWVLENSEFKRWRNDQQSPLLWIKGDPGKGKTMLLCGIINELSNLTMNTALLSFFFCEATDSRINNATAVLRGLIYMLVCQQPSLISHIRKKYDHAGKDLFEDANAWFALSEIFSNALQDPSLDDIYLIIDALDECVTGLPELLGLIAQISSTSRIKWIVSSRNWPTIEKDLDTATRKVRLCLELNEKSVSAAVTTYIQFKVDWLAKRNRYDSDTRDGVLRHLSLNANGTFLWVALVCQELADISEWDDAEEMSKAFPPGLDSLYKRMLDQIVSSKYAKLCRSILAVVSAVRRPITPDELTAFIDMPARRCNFKALAETVELCGSFLALRERTIVFVHQSAKDFLVQKAYNEIYPSRVESIHLSIFSRSLQVMLDTLKRDVYDQRELGISINQVKQPDPDPLLPTRYSCVYWIDHLLDCDPTRNASNDLQDGGSVDKFLRQKFLYWLEALSLCKSMPKAVHAMGKLEVAIQRVANASALHELVRDACRFIMYHRPAIENNPLQAYASALVFSPAHSIIRHLFKNDEPQWISMKPAVEDEWSACLQTLEGHSSSVLSVAFSSDSTRLASASDDNTVRIWDAHSGACLKTLKGHNSSVSSVAFSSDSTRLASASSDNTIRIWDAYSGACLKTLKGHSNWVSSVAFSSDSTRLASASSDNTIRIWDAHSGACLKTLKGHSNWVSSVAFSSDSTRLASASSDNTIRIWDAHSGACLKTLEGHSSTVMSVAFSSDSTRLASASSDNTIRIWDAQSGACLKTLEGHSDVVISVAFSSDSTRLASASSDNTVRIWDTHSGACLKTLGGYSYPVFSVAFSSDSTRLASASDDNTVRIWDARVGACLKTLGGHSYSVSSVTFSSDSTRLASTSDDDTIRIWDAYSGACLKTLEGHRGRVNSVAFSSDSTRLVSASGDNTVRIWDAHSGMCLQTMRVGRRLDNNTGSYVHPGICPLILNTSGSTATPNEIEPQAPRSQGAALSSDGLWITCNSKNLLWLPFEYRPSCSAVSGRTMAIGVGTGKVWMYLVLADKSPYEQD